MLEPRNRNAWVWVAIAAIAIATLSRAEARLHNARAFANPVLELLIKSQSHSLAAKPVLPRALRRIDSRRAVVCFAGSGVSDWLTMLPVFFVGLVAPLTQLSAAYLASPAPVASAPLHSVSFPRPPPYLV
jgi:hypothetical protein